MEQKQNELKQTQEALEQNKKDVKENKNFEYEVEVPYKETVYINRDIASVVMCCTVCEENCHYPGCWWVSDLSWFQKLEEELQELDKEKTKLLNESFDCVETLQKIALNTDSLFTLQHINYLTEKAKTLENIKKRAGEDKQGANKQIMS